MATVDALEGRPKKVYAWQELCSTGCDPRRRPRRSPTASSSCWSARPAAASPRCCAWSPAGGDHRAARSRSATRWSTSWSPKDRDIAMVFQNYALYPHMSVYDNMAYGLKIRGTPQGRDRRARREGAAHPGDRAAARAQAAPALRRPAPARRHGPRHRARAGGVPVRRAAVQPRRQAARADARRDQALQRASASPPIYVTHDQVEAMTLADRLVVMNAGRPSRSARRSRSTRSRPAPSSPASSARRR
jgi:hypothetical protein